MVHLRVIIPLLYPFLCQKMEAFQKCRRLHDPGYGCAAEAVRVIKKGPKWNPAHAKWKKCNLPPKTKYCIPGYGTIKY